jgi:hypothetical protein
VAPRPKDRNIRVADDAGYLESLGPATFAFVDVVAG